MRFVKLNISYLKKNQLVNVIAYTCENKNRFNQTR